jgi:hypothetical protein
VGTASQILEPLQVGKKIPNNHELPKLYMRGFCKPGTAFVWVFERNKPFLPGKKRGANNPYLRGINKVALRPDGYAVRRPDGKTSYEAEGELHDKETQADAAIRKVRAFGTISASEKETLARYTGLTLRRVTSRDEKLSPMLDNLLSASPLRGMGQELAEAGRFGEAWAALDTLDYLKSRDGKNWLLRLSMLQDFDLFHTVIVNMPWNLIKAAPSSYFVTTDNPVVFDKLSCALVFPLSHNVILHASATLERDLEYRVASPSETRLLNSIIIQSAKREIYSPQGDEWVHRGWVEGFSFPGSEENTC